MDLVKISRTQIIRIIASPKFFWIIVSLLVFQAIWIALSGLYPMAFDEDFHLGVINLYVNHPSPFWAVHPDGADKLGPVIRDPSYLYHLLMSYPYQFIGLFTSSLTIKVLFLRFINIGLIAVSLVFWRKLLFRVEAPAHYVHLALLFTILTPVVPLLGAQLNYDNLLMLLTPIVFLLALDCLADIRKKRISFIKLSLLGLTILIASIVKYAFLPIALAVFVFVWWRIYKSKASIRILGGLLVKSFKRTAPGFKIMLIIGLFVSGLLFGERYLVNTVRYHTPIPDCGQVNSIEQCMEYGPWGRDYWLKKDPAINKKGALTFGADWMHGMWVRSFFAVDGPTTGFQTRGPLLLPAIGSVLLTVLSLVAITLKARTVWRRYDATALNLLCFSSAIYVAALWLNGFKAFSEIGKSVAINGRYLVIIAPIIVLVSILAVNELFKARQKLKIGLLVIATICFVWGGGALTYILRSEDAWFWPNNAVRSANSSVRNIIGPITPGYYQPSEFLKRPRF